MSFLRRARGILGMAGVWGFGWILLTLPANLWDSLRLPWWQRLGFIVGAASAWGAWGALSGASFAILLAIAERRLTIHQLSGWRCAIWGALATCSLPAMAFVLGPAEFSLGATWAFGFSAAYGAASAVTMLRAARGRTAPVLGTPVNAAQLLSSDDFRTG